MPEGRVTGFRPSTNGFRFANTFGSQPLFRLPFPGWGGLGLGNAARGMCGGMVFAASDFFHAGITVPANSTPPQHGSLLFDFLVRRLLASFDLPWGVGKFYRWMAAPDGGCSPLWRTVHQEWPRVRRDLDAGRLVPLCIVRPRSRDPFRLGENHQVLAYSYQLDEASADLVLWVYDPNHPCRDDVTLTVYLRSPGRLGIRASTGEPVRGFFVNRYHPYPDRARLHLLCGKS